MGGIERIMGNGKAVDSRKTTRRREGLSKSGGRRKAAVGGAEGIRGDFLCAADGDTVEGVAAAFWMRQRGASVHAGVAAGGIFSGGLGGWVGRLRRDAGNRVGMAKH